MRKFETIVLERKKKDYSVVVVEVNTGYNITKIICLRCNNDLVKKTTIQLGIHQYDGKLHPSPWI